MATDVTIIEAWINDDHFGKGVGGSFSTMVIQSGSGGGSTMSWVGSTTVGAIGTYAGPTSIKAEENLIFDGAALYPGIAGIDLGRDADGERFQKIRRAANDGGMLHRQEVYSNSATAQAEDSIYRWGGSIDSPAIAPTDAVIQEVTGAVAVSGVLVTEGVQFVSKVVGTVAPGNFTTQMTWAVRDSTSTMAVAMTLHPTLFTLTPAVRLSNLAGSGIRVVVADADGDLSATNDITVNSIDFGDSVSYITLDSAGNMVFSDGVTSAGEVTLSDLIGGGPGGVSYWSRSTSSAEDYIYPTTTSDVIQLGEAIATTSTTELRAAPGNATYNTGVDFYIQAGLPYDTAGADAGDLHIRAGDARWGDSGSASGALYLSSGVAHQASSSRSIYLGHPDYLNTAIALECSSHSSVSNVNLSLRQKGTGTMTIGNTNGYYMYLYATSRVEARTATFRVGAAADSIIDAYPGTSGHNDGYKLTVRGGSGYTGTGDGGGGPLHLTGGNAKLTGAGDGGSVYIYGGLSYDSAASDGQIYLGTGSVGALETNTDSAPKVVCYDPDTGLLSYTDLV
jgi:hypothetical protein